MKNKTTIALMALLLGLATPAASQTCPGCIQNSASPQNAQMNIGTATVRGTLTASTGTFIWVNAMNLAVDNLSGNGSAITSLNASQLTSGIVAAARLVGQYTGITGVGTLVAGVWNGTVIGTQYGGTGNNWATQTIGRIPYFSTTGTLATLAPGDAGKILQTNGAAAPTWTGAPSVLGTNVTAIPLANLQTGTLPSGITVGNASLVSLSAAKVSGNIAGGAATLTTPLPVNNLAAGTLSTSNPASSITASGVSAGTYGGPTQMAQIHVNADGRIDSASQTLMAVPPANISTGAVTPGVTIGAAYISTGTLADYVVASSITATGAVPGSYGDNTRTVTLAVRSDGRLGAASQQLIAINTNQINAGSLPLSVTIPAASVTSGTLASNVTATKVANSGVSAGTYGGLDQIPQISIGADGRITSAAQFTIPALSTTAVGSNVDNNWSHAQTSQSSWTFNAPIQATTIISSNFSGNGAGLTSLDPSAMSAGTLPGNVIASSVSAPAVANKLDKTGTTALSITGSAGTITTQSSITASGFFGDGSGLTGVASTGSLSTSGGTMTGTLNFSNAGLAINTVPGEGTAIAVGTNSVVAPSLASFSTSTTGNTYPVISLVNDGGGRPSVRIRSYTNTATNGGTLNLARARGTIAAPLAVISGDDLGNIFTQGFSVTDMSTSAVANIRFRAAETFTAGSNMTQIVMQVTGVGQIVPTSNAMTIRSDTTTITSQALFVTPAGGGNVLSVAAGTTTLSAGNTIINSNSVRIGQQNTGSNVWITPGQFGNTEIQAATNSGPADTKNLSVQVNGGNFGVGVADPGAKFIVKVAPEQYLSFYGGGADTATITASDDIGNAPMRFQADSFEFIHGNVSLEANKSLTLSGASGNIVSASSITASGFFGNGSALTGIPTGVCAAGTGSSSVLCQGLTNTAGGARATVSGGDSNTAPGDYSTIGGGRDNVTSADQYVTVGGGHFNTAQGEGSTIVGGDSNATVGQYATVGGGRSNTAFGDYSLAAGRQAKASAQGSFVWADSQAVDLLGTTTNQFLVRAQGGFDITENKFSVGSSTLVVANGKVGIGTASPSTLFHVSGSSTGILQTGDTSLFYAGDPAGSPSLPVPFAGGNAVLEGYRASGNAAAFALRIARGTRAAPVIPASGDSGSLGVRSYIGGGLFSAQAASQVSLTITETPSAVANGAKIEFEVTPNGSTTRAVAMTLDQNARLGLGTTTPATRFHNTGTTYSVGTIITDSTMTVRGNAFSVGSSTLVVINGSVGVGTTSPTTSLDVNGNAQFGSGATKSTFSVTGDLTLAQGAVMTIPSGNLSAATTGLYVLASSATFAVSGGAQEIRMMNNGVSPQPAIVLNSFSASATGGLVVGQGARGTIGTPTASQSGDSILSVGGRPHDGTNFTVGTKGLVDFVAEEAITPSAQGQRIEFEVTPVGSTTRAVRMVLKGDGSLGIGTTAPATKFHLSTGSITRDGSGWIVSSDTAAVTQLSGCGVGAVFAEGSGDVAGKITTQVTGVITCVMAFKTAPPTGRAPACVVTNETTANLARAASTSTDVTFSGTTVAGDVLSYICIGM